MLFGRFLSFDSSYLMLIANNVWRRCLGRAHSLALDQVELGADQTQRDQHLFFSSQFLGRQPRRRHFPFNYGPLVYSHKISVDLTTSLLLFFLLLHSHSFFLYAQFMFIHIYWRN